MKKGLQLNLQRYGFFKGSHCDSAKVDWERTLDALLGFLSVRNVSVLSIAIMQDFQVGLRPASLVD